MLAMVACGFTNHVSPRRAARRTAHGVVAEREVFEAQIALDNFAVQVGDYQVALPRLHGDPRHEFRRSIARRVNQMRGGKGRTILEAGHAVADARHSFSEVYFGATLLCSL